MFYCIIVFVPILDPLRTSSVVKAGTIKLVYFVINKRHAPLIQITNSECICQLTFVTSSQSNLLNTIKIH